MDRIRTVKITLSSYDRDLILHHVSLFHSGLKEKIKSKRARNGTISLQVNQDELSDLLGCIAREANHTSSKKLEGELDPLFEYLEGAEFELRRGV
jgi:hypothetical protein